MLLEAAGLTKIALACRCSAGGRLLGRGVVNLASANFDKGQRHAKALSNRFEADDGQEERAKTNDLDCANRTERLFAAQECDAEEYSTAAHKIRNDAGNC